MVGSNLFRFRSPLGALCEAFVLLPTGLGAT